jgi:hypothetical protein
VGVYPLRLKRRTRFNPIEITNNTKIQIIFNTTA